MTTAEKAVLFDAYCGKPVAWFRYGDAIIGSEVRPRAAGSEVSWTVTEYTRVLTVAEAVETYGSVTEVVVGIQGGFQSVTFGDTKFMSKELDPRNVGGLMDGVRVTVNDPVTQNYACPKCGAAAGEHRIGVDTRHRVRMKAAAGQ